MNVLICFLLSSSKSECDQEIPQPLTADQHKELLGRDGFKNTRGNSMGDLTSFLKILHFED